MMEAVEAMPAAHRGTLAFLMRLLREVAALSAVNRCVAQEFMWEREKGESGGVYSVKNVGVGLR